MTEWVTRGKLDDEVRGGGGNTPKTSEEKKDAHLPNALVHLYFSTITRFYPIQLLYRQLQDPLLAGLELELGGYLCE
jgi:hypothetical protein